MCHTTPIKVIKKLVLVLGKIAVQESLSLFLSRRIFFLALHLHDGKNFTVRDPTRSKLGGEAHE